MGGNMRLRNKKTGEVEYLLFNSYPVSGDIVLEYMDENAESGYSEYCRYNSLAELNQDWEDYKPIEPLIKDEKIRKAVRAWAEAQGLTEVYCTSNGYEIYGGDDDLGIQFEGEPFSFADRNRIYTIEELCGEDEE